MAWFRGGSSEGGKSMPNFEAVTIATETSTGVVTFTDDWYNYD